MRHWTQQQEDVVVDLVLDLRSLRYFSEDAAPAVTRIILRTVRSTEEAHALVNTMLAEFDEWPGPASMLNKYHELFGRQKDPEPEWFKRYKAGLPPEEETEKTDGTLEGAIGKDLSQKVEDHADMQRARGKDKKTIQ